MLKRNLFMAGGLAVLGLAMVALPGSSKPVQGPDDSNNARLEQRMQELQARLQERVAELAQDRVLQASAKALAQQAEVLQRVEEIQEPDGDGVQVLLGDEGASWLGVETQEVSSDKAKELKLSAERGVLLERVIPDSPAAKAGLKENDVVTEINGQHVEGAAQFRRMIHEIPAGRTAQFTVWRDGRAQTVTVTLGKSEERQSTWLKTAPRSFAFSLPKIEIPDMENMPGMGWSYEMLPGAHPRLGIDAEDLSGQLGSYFGAPDGEGILVRDVNAGSPAEKAGLKAGDVITTVNGERIHSVGQLRERLAAKREDKDSKTVKLGVLRNKSAISISVELPAPPAPKTLRRNVTLHRTNI